jgi:hypothetical protein
MALASALDKKFSLSLFFRHHGRIRWGREDDIVIIEMNRTDAEKAHLSKDLP